MRIHYFLLISFIILFASSFELSSGGKFSRAKPITPPKPPTTSIDADAPAKPARTEKRKRKKVTEEEQQERIRQLQAKIDEVKGLMHKNLTAALARGEKLERLEKKTEKLKSDAEQFKAQTKELKEITKASAFGFKGPLNDVFNGATFTLLSLLYGTLLYDEYITANHGAFQTKIGFVRFAFGRFCEFKWSLTEATRIAWVLIISKMVFDYLW